MHSHPIASHRWILGTIGVLLLLVAPLAAMPRPASAAETTYDISLSHDGDVLSSRTDQALPCAWDADEAAEVVAQIATGTVAGCDPFSVDDADVTSVTVAYQVASETQGEPDENRSVTLAVTVAASKDAQVISAEDVKATVGEVGCSVSATTTGDGELSYAVTARADVASVDKGTGALSLLKAGTATVTIRASETESYKPASKDILVTVTDPVVATYTVKFDKNARDATGTMKAQSVPVGKKTKLSANAFKRDGHSLVSWNTKKDGSGTSYKPSQPALDIVAAGKTVTLYAQWTKDPLPERTVSFNKNAKKATGKMASVTVTQNGSVTLPTCKFARKGYAFTGWNTRSDGKGKAIADGETVVVSDDMTLYAQWRKWYSVTVSKKIRHGSVKVSKTKAYPGDKISITIDPDKGYVLDTLKAKKSKGKAITISKRRRFTMPKGNVTVKATFKKVNPDSGAYRVTVTTDGHGRATATPASGKEGTQVTLSATPNTGYTFASWVIVSGKGAKVDQGKLTIGTENVTVKATFRQTTQRQSQTSGQSQTGTTQQASKQTQKKTDSTPPTGDRTSAEGMAVALPVGAIAIMAGLWRRRDG